jgi:hypothetical protein
MDTKLTPESLLQQIAQIQRLERGTLSVLRQGPQGPYYNHQCYENGRNVSRYIPTEQVPEMREAIEGYHKVQALMGQYVQLLVERTRAERAAGAKKKSHRHNSSWPRNKKSNN